MSKTAKIRIRRMKTTMTPTTTVILLEFGAAPVERAAKRRDTYVIKKKKISGEINYV